MNDDPFDAPESDFDDVVRRRASNNLYMAGAGALFLGFFQFCCNPCLVTTILAGAASMNAIQQPRWLEISLDEDYPASAGMFSRVCGYFGLAMVALMVCLQILSVVLMMNGQL